MGREIHCTYLTVCVHRMTTKCNVCKNNRLRNKEVDYFVAANDNPIPDKCPRLSYDGPAEQTAGYKCPVCGDFTNPYAMWDNRCGGCGYKLNCQ